VRLSSKTHYAVRAVFDLSSAASAASSGPDQATLARDIAERQAIPLRYLEQIFQDLKRAGIVDAKRGPRGGYTLRKSPQELRVGDVIRAMEGPVASWVTLDDEDSKSTPVTSPLWNDFAEAMAAFFDAITFADLAARAAEQGAATPPMYFI